ncbi:MAG TPA: DEAD/DEAH box helicase, partial [Polyangia bacterium]|nr:DEAD/DEAH box helicase [Polyangia bacterium]
MSLFSDLKLPALVTRALTERSYLEAMPVQAAVLEPECAGRDLLVSSQTGSGKTIAFGAVIGQTLLGDSDAKFTRKPRPSALVIVPTRELGVQVREELTWLFKYTGLHLASFTGGTSVTGDLQALRRGVDVAIGTPGRLVDLVRRERLDLTDVAVVVLDEADEMLDLGFREDLETLLKAAPATRRTIMLSATLPPEIRAMARQFQRDALPVDPRTGAGAGAAPTKQAHDDITYVAHLIAAGDRLPAVVNLLRASDAERAIVFCTTREAVGVLHEALLKRGISAAAISGDRAQAERDRALDLVRRGDARVLVATNVAARGIHLPDVDLIIHADLPLNAESLTHRSGRTGRAGRKGTAVLLATATERRKAERLLSLAHVRPTWTPPPSADAITRAACDRLIEELAVESEAKEDVRADEALARLRDRLPEATLLRRLMRRELNRLPAGEVLRAPPAAAAPGAISNTVSLGPTRIAPTSRLVMPPRRQMSGSSQRASA